MTITEARNHYRTIQNLLFAERAMRKRVLSEPRRGEAIREVDQAMASLEALGQVIHAAHEAGLLEDIYDQAPLITDLPSQTIYGSRP